MAQLCFCLWRVGIPSPSSERVPATSLANLIFQFSLKKGCNRFVRELKRGKFKRAKTVSQTCRAIRGTYNEPKDRFDHFYEMLSILDNKSASLMAFNAIGLTALVVWLENIPINFLHLVLDVVFILLLVSCVTGFSVIGLRWFLPSDARDERRMIRERERRSRGYRWSYWLTLVGVCIFLGVSLVHGIGTFLVATDRCGEQCKSFFSEKVWSASQDNPTASNH